MKPEPFAWAYQNANTEHQYLVWHKQEGGRNWMPLFTLQDVQEAILAEREACAKVVGEFAQKWWSIHCSSNRHLETTRKAHDDFCALQAAIRARGETK